MQENVLHSDLKETVKYQHEQICSLKTKLMTHEGISDQNDELRVQLDSLKLWIQSMQFKENEMNKDLLNEVNCQSAELEKSRRDNATMRVEINRLIELSEHLSTQIDEIKQTEQKKAYDMEDLKTVHNRVLKELRNTEVNVNFISVDFSSVTVLFGKNERDTRAFVIHQTAGENNE